MVIARPVAQRDLRVELGDVEIAAHARTVRTIPLFLVVVDLLQADCRRTATDPGQRCVARFTIGDNPEILKIGAR